MSRRRMTMRTMRKALLIVAVAAFYLGHQTADVSARSLWCDDPEVCADSTDCSEACVNRDVYPQENSTCGEYAGFSLDYCDAGAYFSCSWVCPDSGSGEACTDYGAWTTCGSYGDYDFCGNGHCDWDTEDPGSCPSDCTPGSFPEITDEASVDAGGDFAADIVASVVSGGDSPADLLTLQSLAYTYGYAADDA